MRTTSAASLCLLVLLYGLPLNAMAQERQDPFDLPEALAGEVYRVNVVDVLRDGYHLKLDSGARTSVFRWALADGQLPPGIFVRPNGVITGTPRAHRAEPFRFSVKVSDATIAGSDPLVLTFELTVSAPRIKLTSTNAPKLVPARPSAAASFVGGDDEAPADAFGGAGRRREVPAATAVSSNAGQSVGSRIRAEFATYSDRGAWAARGESASEEASSAGAGGVLDVAPPAREATSCDTQCNPRPAPDDKKDFIIDAATGATSGKTKFGKSERTRLVIVNKNPFLYEYKLTVEAKPVEEPGLAAFLDLLPIGKGTFPEAKAADKNAAEGARGAVRAGDRAPINTPCPLLAALLEREKKLHDDEADLKTRKDALIDAFNQVQTMAKPLKEALVQPNAQCPGLCSDADKLRSTLTQHLNATKDAFDKYSKDVAKFEKDANTFSTYVTDLKGNAGCALALENARLPQLAEHYDEVAGPLMESVDKLKKGRENFSEVARGIDKVFATANAFFETRDLGDYDLPTNVAITLERKNITQEKAEFAKYVDTKVNFGGGPRFTLAGGLVASLLENPKYERVPAVVNGAVANVVGIKSNSNSRILPMLMLHGRLFGDSKWKYVDGIHLSLGLTAKPDEDGTKAEFLFGPSISFLERRMFLTFGGYAGKKQELEGNLTLGSTIPKDFGDELPVSEHYVWKPGFAITYKIK